MNQPSEVSGALAAPELHPRRVQMHQEFTDATKQHGLLSVSLRIQMGHGPGSTNHESTFKPQMTMKISPEFLKRTTNKAEQ
jgi:hypothetical protein